MFLLGFFLSAHEDGAGWMMDDIVANTAHHRAAELPHAPRSCDDERGFRLLREVYNGLARFHFTLKPYGLELSAYL